MLGAFIFTYTFGQYTAYITLTNYAKIDIARLKYLQAALPKLAQEESFGALKDDLGSERLWSSAIKIKSLVGKSDVKDLIDPASLNSDQFNYYSIEILGKASSKKSAEERAKEIANFFIYGSVFIDLRDLLRRYEIKVALVRRELVTKILDAEVRLAFIDRRIKTLNELKKQYPSGTIVQNNTLQLTNEKYSDNPAKYLPILTQIIATTIDQEKQKEDILAYKEEADKIRVYELFIEKVKPFFDAGNDPKLIQHLFATVSQILKEVNTNYEKVALSEIEGDLNKIMSFKLYGLTQSGLISTAGPGYLIKAVLSLFGGAFIGILIALGLKVAQGFRMQVNSAE